MKAIVLLFLGVVLGSAQAGPLDALRLTFDDYVTITLQMWPDAGVKDSAMYREMEARHAQLEKEEAAILFYPGKALVLGEAAAAKLKIKPALNTAAVETLCKEVAKTRWSQGVTTAPSLAEHQFVIFETLRLLEAELKAKYPGMVKHGTWPVAAYESALTSIDGWLAQKQEQHLAELKSSGGPGLLSFIKEDLDRKFRDIDNGVVSVSHMADQLEMRRTGNYFTDQHGNMHRIRGLPGADRFDVGDVEVRGNTAFGPTGEMMNVRKDSRGRMMIEP